MENDTHPPPPQGRLLPQVISQFAFDDPSFIIGMNAVVTNNPSNPISYDELSISQLANAVNYMSYWLSDAIRDLNLSAKEPIGFFGLQDFRYVVMEAAAMKIGRPLLLPSPRNAVVNTIALLEQTGCKTLFYSGNLNVQEEELRETIKGLTMIEVPSLDQMSTSKTEEFLYTKTWEEAKKDVALIVHTSGSTGLPKPIYHNQSVLHRLVDAETQIPSVEGRVLAATTLCKPGKPLLCGTNFYHVSGICFSLTAISNRFTAVFGPKDQLPSGQIAVDMIKSMKFAGIVMVPSLLDYTFGKHGEEMLPYLSELEHVNWLGGPLGFSTGTWITTHLPFVHLWQIFGSTETLMLSMLVAPKSHWSYFEFHPTVGPSLDLINEEEGLYEVVIRRHPDPKYAWTTSVFDVFPELEEWRTRDVVRRCPDPGFENLWKYEGRLDDILLLSNGLKVNPLHVETVIQTHPLLSGCLVFGDGHTACGILLEVRDPEISVEEIVEEVWPAIEEANGKVPEHARVERGLVVVSSKEKKFVRSSKQAPIRKVNYKLYREEIEEAYRRE